MTQGVTCEGLRASASVIFHEEITPQARTASAAPRSIVAFNHSKTASRSTLTACGTRARLRAEMLATAANNFIKQRYPSHTRCNWQALLYTSLLVADATAVPLYSVALAGEHAVQPVQAIRVRTDAYLIRGIRHPVRYEAVPR